MFPQGRRRTHLNLTPPLGQQDHLRLSPSFEQSMGKGVSILMLSTNVRSYNTVKTLATTIIDCIKCTGETTEGRGGVLPGVLVQEIQEIDLLQSRVYCVL